MNFRRRRRLTIGGATKQQLLGQLAEQGISLNEYARTLFADPGFQTTTDGSVVEIAIVSLPELGLPDGGTYEEILRQAASLGLGPCPLELAAHLRLSYLDQPEGPYLTVASVELRLGADTPNGFYLRHLHDRLWLRGYESGPENIYSADFSDFAFLL